MEDTASTTTSIDDKTDDCADSPTRDALAEGLMELLRPSVEQLDDHVRLTLRTAKIKHTQLETLVSFMESNPNLSSGKSEKLPLEERKIMWRKLYLELNAVAGGTQKTMEQWKKAWKDQKAKTHGKAMKLIETEGNSTHLTPLEERILKLLSQNNEFKSPIPSTDIFLIPETGIVFSLPIIAQSENQPSVSQDVSNSSSVSKNEPDTTPVFQEISNPVTSGNVSKIHPRIAESFEEILPTAEPLAGASSLSLSSTDVPLIDQESQEKKYSNPGGHNATENINSASVMSYERPIFHTEIARSTSDYPSSTTTNSTFKSVSGKGRKRQRSHLRCHYMTADKAAETFGYISERNCAVLERIASAMEAQASRAAKQTQLMREIINVVKRK